MFDLAKKVTRVVKLFSG